MEKVKEYLNKISKEFGYEYNQSFFTYLKKISKPNQQICNKQVPQGEGGWKCLDCELDSLSLICNNCFKKSKEIHKGHKILFNPNSHGFCDCGDPNVLNKESCCPDHKGPFSNKNDLMNFIKSSIDEKILNNINSLLNPIFLLLIEKIDVLLNKKYQNDEEKKKIEDELFPMIDELIFFVSILYKNNLSLFYFVTLKFTENFPFETNHKCFYYNEDEKKVSIIKENLSEKHNCICPFFQILVYLLMTKKTKYDADSFYTLFIQNYKNKIIVSLSFLHSFTYFFEDDNVGVLRGMGYQLLSDEICTLVYDEKNIFFLENFYNEIYIKFKEFITNNKLINGQLMIFRIYQVIEYLPKINLLDKISSNLNIYNILIDIICLINNFNVFENKIKFDKFQRNGYSYNVLNMELYCLQIVLFISLLLDFDNLETVKFIFNKLITKIKEYKTIKESSNKKTFTPHIVCIRYYTIILNRFCFHYSIKNNCDLIDSFKYFQDIIPESKDINSFLFIELINFFGFIISQKYAYFVYFGEEMKLFYTNYFSSRLYITSDITLMKYLLTLPEIKKELNFEKILIYSNIDSCNDFFLNLKLEDLNHKNENLYETIKKEEKHLKYINSLFEFLLLIIRDNFSMLNLAFKNSNSFRMKYKDKILENLLKNEKSNFENIIKNQIIHHILGNKNIIKRENCLKLYEQYKDQLDIKLIDNLLKENCDEISSSNQLKQFTLKKTNFSSCDLDYIIDYKERENAINYMIEFQSKNFNILNTYIIKPLSIQEKLNHKIYEIIFSDTSFDQFLNLYSNLIINNNYPILTDIFIYTFSKIICFYIKLYKEDKSFEKYQIKLTEILNNNKLEGSNSKLIKYIQNLLLIENITNDKQKNKTDKQKSLKEKYKKKFDEQNQIVIEKYSSSSDIEFDFGEENKILQEEICVFCRQPINNDLSNYYGKICYLISDYFIDILKSKKRKLRKKTSRFVTCNQKIHFNCYSKFLVKSTNLFILKNGFPCPLCKKLSNIIICEFSDILKNNNNILKGLVFNTDNIKDFYMTKEDMDTYQNLILFNKHFFEDYCSKIFKKNILLKDINADKNNIKQLYKSILNDFNSFIIYYNITNNKKQQIDIWRNILYTIRLLCKCKLIDINEFLITKFNLIFQNIKNLELKPILIYDISSMINEFIFCLFALYDLNKENKEEINNIFQKYIILYMFSYDFIKNNDKNFNEYLDKQENQDYLKKIFDLYNLKYKICFLFYDGKEVNLDFNDTIKSLKNNENINIIINKSNNLILNKQNFEIPKFHIIELPENSLEFYSKYMNNNCIYCNKKISLFYVCLFCGNKICNDKKCTSKINEKKKEYSLIDHSKKCTGGNNLYISNKNSEIVYLLKRQFIFSGIYVYVNDFGECSTEYYLTDNYILNKIGLEKGIQMFIDMTFRKKSPKIPSILN